MSYKNYVWNRWINTKLWLILVFLILFGCSEPPQQFLKFRLGVPHHPPNALMLIAVEKKLFEEQGLEAEIIYYPSGKRALIEGLLEDKVDYISSAGIPFVWQSFQHDDLMILTSLYSTDNHNRIIARKDAGIFEISDLRGKKVATQRNSAVHYFLRSFMQEHQLPKQSIDLCYFKAENLPEKLALGEIDAFSMREPYISQALDAIGEDNSIIFQAPGLYIQSDILVARRDYLKNNELITEKVLRALIKAEEFTQKHPQQAITIVANILKIPTKKIEDLWRNDDLSIKLEHSLLRRLEQQGLWMIQEQLTDATELPDFRSKFYTKPLKTVKPEVMLLIQ